MFSDKTLDDIRQRIDIVELVGEYVQLKKSGATYLGLCPIHGEKTPSFAVNSIKQIFHCFGCHKGGNVFTFLKLVDGVSFPEAVEKLAARAGITIVEESRSPKKQAPNKDEARLFEALQWAAEYFHYLLVKHDQFQFARDYISSRGISQLTIEKFKIGVSPIGKDKLINQLLKRGYKIKELIDAGLASVKEGNPNDVYDRYRERLMFPIKNKEGIVIGFGARTFKKDEKAFKYLNSPDSPHFNKRKHLYGLSENQRGIRLKGETIVVEGYMDVVGLYEMGVQNAVASMGTALTEEHCQEIKSVSQKVVTVFDPDKAGVDAWHRSVALFLSSKILAKDLSLPTGLDPDEFVRKEGAEKFYALCDEAPKQVTKYLKEIASKGLLSEQETAKQLELLTPILVASKNLPERSTIWDDISLVLKVSRQSLTEIVEKSQRFQPAPTPKQSSPIPKAKPMKPPAATKFNFIDLEFLEACLASPTLFIQTPSIKWVGLIKDAKINTCLEKLKGKTETEFKAEAEKLLHSEEDPILISKISASLISDSLSSIPGALKPESVFEALLLKIEKRAKEERVKSLTVEIKLAQRMKNETEVNKLLKELQELRSL